jgi:hypothetical protein
VAERSEHAAGSFRFVRVGDGLRGVHGRRGLDVRERVNTRRPHWEVILSAWEAARHSGRAPTPQAQAQQAALLRKGGMG